MICPECGGETRVLETRDKTNGTTRRRHECANRHRFTTMEQIVGAELKQRVLLACEAKGDELTNVWIDVFTPTTTNHHEQNRNSF